MPDPQAEVLPPDAVLMRPEVFLTGRVAERSAEQGASWTRSVVWPVLISVTVATSVLLAAGTMLQQTESADQSPRR